ncbi:hypothetical protein ACFYKX_11105 [Cytobacillus sp. FJAT-54145]|uniref:Uncharacterized protein n=1 Tax=Cytobacillus spartinae TaxID=3299023 RepID=A0ABW6KAC2_9BACI
MILENGKLKNRSHKDDIDFRRALLDKHSQLMRMHLRYHCFKRAKEEFESVKSLFTFLHDKGETMDYYTLDDFKQDSMRFEK